MTMADNGIQEIDATMASSENSEKATEDHNVFSSFESTVSDYQDANAGYVSADSTLLSSNNDNGKNGGNALGRESSNDGDGDDDFFDAFANAQSSNHSNNDEVANFVSSESGTYAEKEAKQETTQTNDLFDDAFNQIHDNSGSSDNAEISTQDGFNNRLNPSDATVIDPFGSFGEANIANENSGVLPEALGAFDIIPDENNANIPMDDFGGFESTEKLEPASISVDGTSNDIFETPPIANENENNITEEKAGDDFISTDDFGTFIPVDGTTSPVLAFDSDADVLCAEDVNAEESTENQVPLDDFGAFGSMIANEPTLVLDTENDATESTMDDFAFSGSAEGETSPTLLDNVAEAPNTIPLDDFGTFESVTNEPPTALAFTAEKALIESENDNPIFQQLEATPVLTFDSSSDIKNSADENSDVNQQPRPFDFPAPMTGPGVEMEQTLTNPQIEPIAKANVFPDGDDTQIHDNESPIDAQGHFSAELAEHLPIDIVSLNEGADNGNKHIQDDFGTFDSNSSSNEMRMDVSEKAESGAIAVGHIDSGMGNANGDEFGTFDYIESTQPTEDLTPLQKEEVASDDDLRDFGSVEGVADKGENAQNATSKLKDPSVFDSDVQNDDQIVPDVTSMDSFNMINASKSEVRIANDGENIGDDFKGVAPFEEEFTAQMIATVETECHAPSTAEVDALEDEFDFGAGPSPNEATQSSEDNALEGGPNDDTLALSSDGIDFVGFDTADIVTYGETNAPDLATNDKSNKAEGGRDASAVHGDADDFGGFSSFEAVPPAEAEFPTQEIAAARNAGEGGNPENGAYEDFGGFTPFGGHPTTDVIGGSQGIPTAFNDDHHFGGFAPLDEAKPSELEASTQCQGQDHSESNDKDLDAPETEPSASAEPGPDSGVGSFEETPASQLNEVASSGDDDDFGGFESFEDTPTETEGPSTQSQPNEIESSGDDAEFGGFGSFEQTRAENEGPSTQSQQKEVASSGDDDDDFGGFGSFEETPTANEGPSMQSQPNEIESSGDDAEFGGFGSFEQTPVENEGPSTQSQPNEVASSGDDDDFGGFGSFEETPTANEGPSTQNQQKEVEGSGEADGFGSFEDTPTATEGPSAQSQLNEVAGSGDNDDCGGFGSFAISPAETEELGKQGEQKEVASAGDDDDDFGGFGSFEETPAANEGPNTQSQPNEVAGSGDDYDFGSFEETPAETERPSKQNQKNEVASSGDDDDFGEFGSFEETPTANEGPSTQSQPNEVVSSGDDDDFGDFGDFEDFKEAPETLPTDVSKVAQEERPTQIDKNISIAEKEVAHPAIISESVRIMFHNVFDTDTSINVNIEEKADCSELPFCVPLRDIMPLVISTEEKNEKECYQSEKELTKIKEFLKGLPRSPPVSILSDEKWYPYSQYVFHSDGTLFTDSVERVAAPTVPDVLSIDLPTGFDFSKPSKQKSSTPPQQKAIPIDGGLPPTPEVAQARHVDKVEVDAEQSAKNDDGFGERDELHSQLSAKGKRFYDQLPDLSYMLKSTLSVPKDRTN